MQTKEKKAMLMSVWINHEDTNKKFHQIIGTKEEFISSCFLVIVEYFR